ncbi:MAG: sortase [Eubacteriales bacterium]|nr:sortase [Christensenellaceae bacterium]MEA5064697.1 sortase [Eubacteriales bacterium]
MKRKLTLWLALLMALMCLMPAALAQDVPPESKESNEVTIPLPEPPAETSEPVETGEPNLALSMSLAPQKVAPGGSLVWTVQLTNNGLTAVTNPIVTGYMPEDFAPVYPEALPGYDSAANRFTWSPPSVGVGETLTLAINLMVASDAVAAEAPFSTVLSTSDGQVLQTVVGSVNVVEATLRLSMRSNIKRAEPGDAVAYTIEVTNTGKIDAADLWLTNDVPENMTIDPGAITGNGEYDADAGQIVWEDFDLAAGKSKTFKFVGVIPSDAAEGEVYVNTAELNDLVAVASVTVYEPQPELSITKKVNNRTPAPGTTVKYTITVKNTGGADAYDVEVFDRLPEDLEINKKSITEDGEYSARNNEISWMVDVPAYDKVVLTFKAYVPDWMEDGDVLVNRARIPEVGSAKATMVVTEDAVPKTGDPSVVPAAWAAPRPVQGPPTPQNLIKTQAAAPAPVAPREDGAAIPPPPIAEAFQAIHAQNSDMVGWLKVADQVDLPIVQAQSNDFYMVRNFDKRDDEAGALFLDERNHLYPSDQHLLIYGHNMKSGKMFGKLSAFRDLKYLKANPTFTFQSAYEVVPTTYVTVAVLDASMTKDNPDYLKVRKPNFDDEADAASYIDSLKSRSYFDIPVAWDASDRLLSLVTCSYLQDNGRLIVIGRPLRAGETPESVAAQVAQAQGKA